MQLEFPFIDKLFGKPKKQSPGQLGVFEEIRENCATVGCWSFTGALGNTLKEKYGSLYVYLLEVCDIIRKKSDRECNFILTSSELLTLFTLHHDWRPQGVLTEEDFGYIHTINARRIYCSSSIPRNEMLLGVNPTKDASTFYGERPNFKQLESPLHALRYAAIKVHDFLL